MKNYIYKGDLEEDIKNAGKKFNLTMFLKCLIKAIPTACIAIVFCFIFSTLDIPAIIGCYVFSAMYHIVYNNLTIKRERENAEHRLDKFAEEFNLDLHGNTFEKTKIKSNIKDSIVDSQKSQVKIKEDGITTYEKEKTTTYFYLLDRDEQIQVLRQIRSTIVDGDKKTKSRKLCLLEPADIEKENIEIPVQKTIGLKRKQN